VSLNVDSTGTTVDSMQLTNVTQTTPAGDVLYTLTLNSDGHPGTNGTTAEAFFGDGFLYYSEKTQVDSTLTLEYNDLSIEAAAAAAYSANIGGGTPAEVAAAQAAAYAVALTGAQDFTDGGSSTDFYFDVVFSAEGFDLSLQITDILGNSATGMLNTVPEVLSPTKLYLGFGAFAGVDLTKVVNVVATINSNSGSDLTLAEVGTIPEPTTVALFGLGLLGFAFNSRKKSK
jgi:hypothetical protein